MFRLLDYLLRIGKSRGFGIQSPWAYSFVRDVIFERHPYYAYAEIEDRCISKKEAKRQKLYHRLRNYCHDGHLFILNLNNYELSSLRNLMNDVGRSDIVCIEDIYKCQSGLWDEIREMDCVGITFDLYDLAIVFPKNDMFKQHYKLNF